MNRWMFRFAGLAPVALAAGLIVGCASADDGRTGRPLDLSQHADGPTPDGSVDVDLGPTGPDLFGPHKDEASEDLGAGANDLAGDQAVQPGDADGTVDGTVPADDLASSPPDLSMGASSALY